MRHLPRGATIAFIMLNSIMSFTKTVLSIIHALLSLIGFSFMVAVVVITFQAGGWLGGLVGLAACGVFIGARDLLVGVLSIGSKTPGGHSGR